MSRPNSLPLSNFLIEASQNPALLRRLKEAPGAVAEQAGLNGRELRALLSEDSSQLHSVLAGGAGPPYPLMISQADVAEA